MYHEFYNFERPPFDNIPDPHTVFLSPAHKKTLAVLEYAIMARAGFCVVSGEVGTGKTTMVRKLLQDIDRDFEVGLVTNTQFESFQELLKWILLAFDLPYDSDDKVALYDSFTRFLIERFESGRPVTLIIDEAHNLEATQMEQLRMLSNVNTENGLVLQTILVGQPELWDTLKRHELRQFAHRISYDVRLEPLPTNELTGEYIRTRLTIAGGSPDLFEEDTYPYIWLATDGLPRLINMVCDTALVYGYAEEKPKIDLDIISQVLNDKHHSLAPIRHNEDEAPSSPAPTKRSKRNSKGDRVDVESDLEDDSPVQEMKAASTEVGGGIDDGQRIRASFARAEKKIARNNRRRR